MTIFVFADNAKSTLAAPISAGSTAITLAPGDGALFPAPAAGQAFALVLNDVATQQIVEVCWCTARSGDVLTVQRGREGTTATSWVIGDLAWNGPTSGQMANMVQTPHMFDASISPTFGGIVGEGNIVAAAGRLRASVLTFASGDPNAATLLGDFVRGSGSVAGGGQFTSAVAYTYTRDPFGTYDGVFSFTMHWGGMLNEEGFFNIPFGSAVLDAIISLGSPGAPVSLANGAQGTFAVGWSGPTVFAINNFVDGDVTSPSLGPLGMVVRARFT